jgi:hypothetical protein
MSVANDRNAALLIRVWRERADVFHARLTALDGRVGQSSVEDLTVVVASSPRDVLHAVSAWLDQFLDVAVTSIDSVE